MPDELLTWDPDDESFTWDSPLPIGWDFLLPNLNPTPIMSDENQISIVIAPATKTAILAKLAELRALVLEFAINLTPDERMHTPTISTERSAMVTTFDMQMATHPDVIPGYVDMPEKDKDSAAFGDLAEMLAPAMEICEMLSDTVHLVGADLLKAYLTFYSAVQMAAKNNVPGATTLLEDLRRFIPRGRKSGGSPASTPAP